MANNKTVLITGASSGIGFELSKIFAQNGYNIFLVSQNEENLNRAVSQLCKQHKNVQITSLAKDLSNPLSPHEIYSFIKENSIEVDILINNAGIQVYGNFHETNLEENIKLMTVNMTALIKLTRLFVDDMIRRGHGKVLNIGSTASFSPGPLNAVYCASKAFVLHFSEAIAEELKGTGVTVTTLCPGSTNTNFARRAKIEDTNAFKGKVMDASKVAEIGFNALMKGRTLVVAGMFNKLMVLSIKFSPRSMLPKVGKKFMSK